MALLPAKDLNGLIASFAVNTHMSQGWQYGDGPATVACLQDLGITTVRDGFGPLGSYFQNLYYAAQQSIKFCFNVGSEPPSTLIPKLEAWESAYPGAIIAIEGPNETNNWPVTYNGQTGVAAAQAYQTDLYNAVKASSALNHIPVVGQTSWPVYANASDIGNVHAYDRSGNFPRAAMVAGKADEVAANPTRSAYWLTECGVHTHLGADYDEGVSEAVQAKIALSLFFDAYELGFAKTFYYQLGNQYTDPNDEQSYFGLVKTDWTAKPAFTALKNLLSILKASAGAFSPGSLDYSLTGLPSTGHHMLFRGAGDFVLVVWNEPDIWNETTNVEIPYAPVTVTLGLGSAANVARFDPLSNAAAVDTVSNAASLPFYLGASPLVFRISATDNGQEPVLRESTVSDTAPAGTAIQPIEGVTLSGSTVASGASGATVGTVVKT